MALIENRVLAETIDNQIITDATTKRLLLAEVYVHKRPKLSTTSESVDYFEVFHIFEIDDSESKIIPKLSTNCSEPVKIIEVLKNFTGSDTPQLKRLIDKLGAQNEKWINNRKTPKRVFSKDALDNESNRDIEDSRKSHAMRAKPYESSISTRKSVSPAIEHPENGDSSTNHFISPKPIESLVSTCKSISCMTNTAANNGATNQSIKLWNHIMSHPDDNMNDTFELIVVEGKEKTVFSLKATETEPASTNGTSLKIGQVFGSVNDEFVEKLLIDRTQIETVMQQIQNNTQTSANLNHSRIINEKQTANKKKTAIVNERVVISKHEIDLRCNFCLTSCEKFDELQEHMFTEHRFSFVCDICFEPFKFRGAYDCHRAGLSSFPCKVNASRPYICIVDPPVILLKKKQVHAFKCKHCKLAFFNQKNYVQHAQKHATSFRCKRCPSSKPSSAEKMVLHLLSCDNNC